MNYKNKIHVKKSMNSSLKLLTIALIMGGCSLAPQYQQPKIESNIPLPLPSLSGDIQLRASQIGWKNYYQDPQLKALIQIGLKNNYDVQKALINFKKANAQYGLDIYNLIPNFQFDGISKTRSGPLDNSSKTLIQQKYSAGLGVTRFELDWYRKFDQATASQSQLRATYYDKLNAEISTISSIAKKYFESRINEEILTNAEQTIAYQKELFRIQELRNQAGIISKLELLNHQNALDNAQSEFLNVQERYTNSANELAILIGQPIPKNLPLRKPLDQQFAYKSFPKDLPSDVMYYRPDIRSMEELLKQGNAQIGVARAAFFPRIVLNGSINAGSTSFNNLFNTGNMGWSAGPGITIPLFDIFPNITNLKVAKLNSEQLILNYNNAIQQAFFEVITALNVSKKLDSQFDLSMQIMQNNEKTRDLTRLRFNQGITDRNEMLEAENNYINSQNSFLSTLQTKLFNQIDLYRALGGGVNRNNPQPKLTPSVKSKAAKELKN